MKRIVEFNIRIEDRFKCESCENQSAKIRRFLSNATILCYFYVSYDKYLHVIWIVAPRGA